MLGCLSNFCWQYRESPTPKSVAAIDWKVFEVSDYHPKKIAELLKELKAVEKKSAESLRDAAVREDKEAREQHLCDQELSQSRYEVMLAAVEAWRPPSEAHENIKNFMRDQPSRSPQNCVTPAPHRP